MGSLTGVPICHVSILRNSNVPLSSLKNIIVTLSNLRNCHVACHIFYKPMSYVTKPKKGPCRHVHLRDLGPYLQYILPDRLLVIGIYSRGCIA